MAAEWSLRSEIAVYMSFHRDIDEYFQKSCHNYHTSNLFFQAEQDSAKVKGLYKIWGLYISPGCMELHYLHFSEKRLVPSPTLASLAQWPAAVHFALAFWCFSKQEDSIHYMG